MGAICTRKPRAQADLAAWPQCQSSSRPAAASSRLLLPPASQLLLPGGLQNGLGRVPHSQLQAGKEQEGTCWAGRSAESWELRPTSALQFTQECSGTEWCSGTKACNQGGNPLQVDRSQRNQS